MTIEQNTEQNIHQKDNMTEQVVKTITTEIVESGLPRLMLELDKHLQEGWKINHKRPAENLFTTNVVHLYKEVFLPNSTETVTTTQSIPEASEDVVQKKPGRPAKK